MQGYNVQEADRMSVAIHPSEARRSGSRDSARPRMRNLALIGGSVALLAFTAGAFSFFSDLADPRARPARSAPVVPLASQWPDLRDGVPALAEAPAGAPQELRRASLRVAVPAALPSPDPVAPAPVQASPTVVPAAPARAALPLEPAQTLPPAARTAAAVTPAKVAVPLPPTRSETVRAKTEQPAKFVSLPAKPETPKPETATKPETAAKPQAKADHAPSGTARAAATKAEASKAEASKSERAKAEAAKAEAAKAEAARRTVSPARARTPETKPTRTASAQAPAEPAANPPAAREASDEPELLGVKIPGGRQIREGWDAAVNGLLGGK